MKAEAALLIALADIGGAWPVMRAARALTDLADTAVDAASRFALAEAARAGRLALEGQGRSRRPAAAISSLPWARWAPSSSITPATSTSSCSTTRRRRPCPKDAEPAPVFVKVTQRLVKLLQERTADGYVFRTDLRLRPDPASTAIAISTPAAVSYYESVGQNWERAAMIKARACAGDIEAGEALLNELAPFVWRKYLDYRRASPTCTP